MLKTPPPPPLDPPPVDAELATAHYDLQNGQPRSPFTQHGKFLFDIQNGTSYLRHVEGAQVQYIPANEPPFASELAEFNASKLRSVSSASSNSPSKIKTPKKSIVCEKQVLCVSEELRAKLKLRRRGSSFKFRDSPKSSAEGREEDTKTLSIIALAETHQVDAGGNRKNEQEQKDLILVIQQLQRDLQSSKQEV